MIEITPEPEPEPEPQTPELIVVGPNVIEVVPVVPVEPPTIIEQIEQEIEQELENELVEEESTEESTEENETSDEENESEENTDESENEEESSEEATEEETKEETVVAEKKTKKLTKAQKKKAKEKKMREIITEKLKELAIVMGEAQSLEDQQALQQLIAALINYVPGFDAYGQLAIPGVDFYQSDEIYKDKKIPENLRGLRNGLASELLWNKMVDEQYEGME